MTSSPAAGLHPEPPVSALPGIGPRHAANLERLDIRSAFDLLTHYPSRWVDRRVIRPIASLGEEDTHPLLSGPDAGRKPVVTVLGRVIHAPRPPRNPRQASRRPYLVTIRDETGSVGLAFFGGGWRHPHFATASPILVSGTLTFFRGVPQFQNPEYEILADEEEAALHTERLFPVYRLTRGVTQRQVRTWVRTALERLLPRLEETLPVPLRERHGLVSRRGAIAEYHFPGSPGSKAGARRRLVFEEFLLDQLFVRAVKLRREAGKLARPIRPGPLYRRIHAALPFTLTPDQDRALREILEDLGRARPASRLLQGDVGSGKTVVALLAAAAAADSGLQTAFMVPTEILAEQHLRTLNALGRDLGLEARWLVGSMSPAARSEVLKAVKAGSAPLVVGTHALFQESVEFQDLGLVVVDEQHRFGVAQRVALMEKGRAPHVLAMSATPIPRSLALVHYADLDLSVLQSRPSGRGKVITRITSEDKREKVYGFLADRLREGRQAYVVYPLVDESETSELKAATTMAEELAARPEFRAFEVALLHGQMRAEAKDAVMRRFVAGEVQVLVATTVIEVGIDVPNASFLLVEHPERYGLSQLHQLRGRIGRGAHTSYCVLIPGAGLDPDARDRLRAFARTDDGFELARMDLELRGRGDVAGTRQSGRPGFKVADPLRHPELAELARAEADRLIEEGVLFPEGGPEWEPLRSRVRALLEAAGSLADAG